MLKTVILFIVLATSSVSCKVILTTENDVLITQNTTKLKKSDNNVHDHYDNEKALPDVTDNLIKVPVKPIPVVQIELPGYNKIIKSIFPSKKDNRTANKVDDKVTLGDCKNNTNNCTAPTKDCVYKDVKTNDIDDKKAISSENIPCEVPQKVDNGTALILTPFIEKGQIEEARNACRVNSEIFLGVESYSGFLTVNKTYDSNLFFWYFPVEKKKVNETPWIIWLQGGPGASSLVGVFDEIGPFKVNNLGVLKKNPLTWVQNHSLVFIDNPVGTGYSFTKHRDGLAKDMTTYGSQLYIAVQQLLQIFPELRSAPLFIAGESYGGKYAPALAIQIHNHKDEPGSNVNLQGIILGNAYIDPSTIWNVTHSFYYFGLLNKEQIQIVDPLLKSFQQDIATNNSIGAKDKWISLIAILQFLTHQKQVYNFMKDDMTFGHYVGFLKPTEVKRALHVGDIKYTFVNITVNTVMAADFLSSAKPLFETLLNHYRVLAYCGNLDQMLPCVSTSKHYRTWNWNGTSEFLEATRYPYIFNARLAGYHKSGGRLTEVVVRGAGHMVPVDAPAPIQNLVARWTHNQPLSRRFGLLEGSYVQEYVRNHSLLYI